MAAEKKKAKSQRKWINWILLEIDDIKKKQAELEESVNFIRKEIDKLKQSDSSDENR